MIPVNEQVRALIRAVSAVKTLPQVFLAAWLSVMGFLCLLVRPEVTRELGPRHWWMTYRPAILLVFLLWITLVALVRWRPRDVAHRR